MSRALALLIRYAFEELGLHRLELAARRKPAQLPRRRAPGLPAGGELRDAQLLNGRFWNMRCYGLLADEWKNRR
ncbi:Uncharacterised protein [Chromobacterium violaceum]|uniref:Ribosomal N-acetyltransferase YdaF n=1 Tax=Chromobacterium violaceum TaxID=536 RepID=A0A3S4LI58_CHRVL|nr:Uncharacterised protein [Chromobacterium violaceum]